MTSRSKSPTAAAPFILPSTGRVIREEQNDYIIEHGHDAAGNLFMSRGGFGHLMELDYNADNRLESVTIEDVKYIRIVCAMPPAGPSNTIFPAP